MAIFLDENSRIIVQGVTGAEGREHTARMLAAGANIVGGVNPRKAGETLTLHRTELPVFGAVAEAVEETGANVTVIFVPPAFAKSAMIEAIDARVPLAVVITEASPSTTPPRRGRTRRKSAAPASSARTAPVPSPRRSPWPGSSPPPSPARVRWGWCPSPAP